jgi:predicted ATPase/class 3 adenylate cyclase
MRNLPTSTITLLFTDIEGSTRLLTRSGDRYGEVLAECRRLLRGVFERWHGREVDTQGDAFFVVFARAADAVSAAVEAQRALAVHAWPEGITVHVRMGLDTGEPFLLSEGYVGVDVHIAARIMSAGHGGQVLLSQATRELVEHALPGGVSLRDLGEHRLKDFQRPNRLFQLLIAGLPVDFPPLKTHSPHPNHMPVQSTQFIGREKEVAAVMRLLRREDVRLVTLTGPGGTGKTRLALQVVAELSDLFADGISFVDLAPVNDPALVIVAIVQSLGFREVGGQPPLERLRDELLGKHMLLLLDNFEQVVSTAVHVADLLATCAQLKVLVTSRVVMHIQAEHEFFVPPLSLPDPNQMPDLAALSQYESVALFLRRAQRARPDFGVTNANASAVAEICVRLDGLPLAIELAAARMKLLSPEALLARLDQPLHVLTSGPRDVVERQQTLRNTIEWSYQLLDAKAQQLFRRLSVFVGGCRLSAIEATSSGDEAESILNTLAFLADNSLLLSVEQRVVQEPRFAMLETIREYALGRLEAFGETEVARRAHAAYFLQLAEEAEAGMEGPQQAVLLERLEQEHDNLRAAMQWSLEHAGDGRAMALRLGGALYAFWFVRAYFSEGRDFLERALSRSDEVAAPVRAKAYMRLRN